MFLFAFQPELKQSTMNTNNDEDDSDDGGDDGSGSDSDHSFCNEIYVVGLKKMILPTEIMSAL